MNLCRKRLSILKNKLDLNVDESFIKLNPGEQLCSMSTTNTLTDEVGIKELDLLYYDIFDLPKNPLNILVSQKIASGVAFKVGFFCKILS